MLEKRKIRVLLVDDQELFVQSLRYVLEARAPDIEVVGVAHDGAEAVMLAETHQPEIILMDVRMPEMDGVKATKIIHEIDSSIKIVMLTTFSDDQYVKAAIRHGAIGYLLKNIPPQELIKSIRSINNGVVQISPSVAKRLALNGEIPPEVVHAEERVFREPLTRREKEVLQLILKANDNKEIAEFLNVAEQTARNYVHNLYSKLAVSSRTQLLKLMNKS